MTTREDRAPARGRRSRSAVVLCEPDRVLARLTDIPGLPEWNSAITRVVHVPAVLEPGAEWVVELAAMGQRWQSRSRLEELDVVRRRFAYRSATDDGNPSWARWTWQVDPHPSGSRVEVGWELHPVTFWRRVLLSHVRGRQLARREVPASLDALAADLRAG